MAFRGAMKRMGLGQAIPVVLLLAVVLLAGCIPIISVRTVVTVVPVVVKTCTLLGCGDTLVVTLKGDLPQQFKVTLVGSDGSEVTSDCDLAHLEENGDACEDRGVDYDGEDLVFSTAPAEVALRIEWEGGEIEQEFAPQYEFFYPNGQGCEPECKQGFAEIQIP